jgi:hypothetical protein
MAALAGGDFGHQSSDRMNLSFGFCGIPSIRQEKRRMDGARSWYKIKHSETWLPKETHPHAFSSRDSETLHRANALLDQRKHTQLGYIVPRASHEKALTERRRSEPGR